MLQLIPSSLCTMILYLLVPALVLAQTANVTEEVVGNQTFTESTAVNSTMKPDNVTSNLYKDERSHIKDELQNNDTSTLITEDNEMFQEQENEIPATYCHRDLLVELSHMHCGAAFHTKMMSISRENWCVQETIIRPYNHLTLCVEELSHLVGCYYPHPNIHDFYLEIHSFYFHNCSNEEHLLVDAPQGLVIVLTLIPVSLIPVLVYLVVWKSKIQD